MRVFNDLASDASAACAHAGGPVQMTVCIGNYIKQQAQKTAAAAKAAVTGSSATTSAQLPWEAGASINPMLLQPQPTSMSTYLLLGGLAVLVIGGAVVIKKHRRAPAPMAGYRRRRR